MVGGVVLARVLVVLGVGIVILSALLGITVGRLVRWGTRGQTQQPFAATAVACALLGVLVAGILAFATPVPNLWFLLAYPVAGWFAARGLHL
ncbi:MAG TPA: hypothetical protein VG452_11410 [Egibacteraceae bacterium]|nr:hypothetical protein [Egibacteraceae bacterium]